MTEAETGSTEQQDTPIPVPEPTAGVASTSQRQALDNITRALTDAEVTNPAAVKLIIHMLRTAEADRDGCKRYVDLYHEANTQVGVLTERLKANYTNEILFAVGVALGGTLLGLAPYIWEKDHLVGGISIGLAVVLIVGSVAARANFGFKK